MNKIYIYFLLSGIFFGLLYLGYFLKKQAGFSRNTVVADKIFSNNAQSPNIAMSYLNDYIVITETPVPTPALTSTPVPTITPTPVYRFTSSQLDEWFTRFASENSIDRSLLIKIAVCESGLNPLAVNGIYGGLFQFSSSAWTNTRKQMNEDTNPELRFNAELAIKTAAFKIAVGGKNSWPNCGK